MNFVSVISFSLVLLSLAHQLAAVGGKEHEENNGVQVNKCFDIERRALLDFKASIRNDPLGFFDTWTPAEEDDCCKWKRVTCSNQTGHVTELHLSGDYIYGGLEGEISSSLLKLTYLHHLDLSINYFNRKIPKFIGSMTRLKYLDLSHNDFHGTVPQEFGNLTNLRYLSLSYNENCTLENIDLLSRLSHLEHLELDEISLAKANHWVNAVLSLQNLSYLRLLGSDLSQVMYPYSSPFLNTSSSSIATLDLSHNNLNSSMYHWLLPLTSNNLVSLDLHGNLLDGIPKYLGNLCSLKDLLLYDNILAAEFPDLLKDLSGCTSETLQSLCLSSNQLTGSLPDQIQKFSSLRELYLSDNHLSGNISEKVWKLPKLEMLIVNSNSLRGHVLFENSGNSKLTYLLLSNNSLEVIPSHIHMSNLSSVEYIGLSSCKLGPGFPTWILTLTNLTGLNIANTRIADTIPTAFWKMSHSRLTYLNLSSNNINGKVPDLLSNFDPHQYLKIDLSNNSFHGPIPDVPSNLASLNLSRNKFNGGLSFLCQIVDGFLVFLDLSYNSLTGQLPDCLWHFKSLEVLNLGHNNLSGTLPASLGYLVRLEVLYLYNNNFSGYLPSSLKNCTNLNFLDLGSNRFFGNVPVWIGDNLSRLYALSIRSNNFSGAIPLQFCQLLHLQILDLSINNLYGTIPSCVNNLNAMVQEGFSQASSEHELILIKDIRRDRYAVMTAGTYLDNAIIEWQGNEQEFYRNNLRSLKLINLACNNLSGQIPNELTDLHELLVLNLSKNALLGEIPQNIGQMGELLTLDLSKNKFSGELPSSMSSMTFLNYLDVSCNNLSGRIPLGTQLQSFPPSRYDGNPLLCGVPITKYCPGDDKLVASPIDDESVCDREDKDELERWFYIGGATGFAIGFWIACSLLILNHRGRHIFFRFFDSFKDWVYIKVVLLIAKL